MTHIRRAFPLGWPITARDIWRAWFFAMDWQGREIEPERRSWETLPQQEKDLDADIADQLNHIALYWTGAPVYDADHPATTQHPGAEAKR